MMIKICIILTLSLTVSCNKIDLVGALGQEISTLEEKIYRLELENFKLKDSLEHKEFSNIISYKISTSNNKRKLTPNKPNNFKFNFTVQKLTEYSVYVVTKNERKLLYKNINKPEFEYNFIPENSNDNSFKIFAYFLVDGKMIAMEEEIKL